MGTSKALRCHLIYCLQRRADGSYIALNRNYKPIGFMDSNLMENPEQLMGFDFAMLSPATIQSLSWDGSCNPDAIFLYSDDSIPFEGNVAATQAYMDRLARFASLRITPHESLMPYGSHKHGSSPRIVNISFD